MVIPAQEKVNNLLNHCFISATSIFNSLTWDIQHRVQIPIDITFQQLCLIFLICACIDSAYLQRHLICFFFFAEEERHLQANKRDFNLQFEYAVSNQHMLLCADAVTDAAASVSCLLTTRRSPFMFISMLQGHDMSEFWLWLHKQWV